MIVNNPASGTGLLTIRSLAWSTLASSDNPPKPERAAGYEPTFQLHPTIPHHKAIERRYDFMRWLISLLLIPPVLASADSFRCNGYLVNTGDSQSRVLEVCGDPRSARQDGFIEQVVRRNDGISVNPASPNAYPNLPTYEVESRRVIPVYKWEYNLGHGTFLRILTFHGDTLVDITDGPRQ